MRLYNALVGLVEAITEAVEAWAEGERLGSLEYQFDMADEDGHE